MTYVGETGDRTALEVTVVQLLYRGPEISCAFELDETIRVTRALANPIPSRARKRVSPPSSSAVSARLGIYHIEAGLPGEVFEVLIPEVRVSGQAGYRKMAKRNRNP